MRKLTKLERAYLSRRVCWLCEQRLDRTACMVTGGRACTRACAPICR